MISPASSATSDEDRYLRLAALSQYSSLSVKTLQRAIADPVHPLRAHKVGRLVLVRKSDFDAWLERREPAMPTDIDTEIAAGNMSEAHGRAVANDARAWVRKLVGGA